MSDFDNVVYLKQAETYLKKLKEKPLKEKFYEAIKKISKDPYIGEAKTGDLSGIYCYNIRYTGINYELAYYLDCDEDGNIIVVILAGTRENFYKELKRIMKDLNRVMLRYSK